MYGPELSKLLNEGAKLYSKKEYELASDKYAEACEIYNKENGEDDPDLLLLYGKSLFQNAVSRSEVFGGGDNAKKENEDVNEDGKEDGEENEGNFQFCDDAPLAEEEDDESNRHQQNENDTASGLEPLNEVSNEQNEGEEEEQSDFEVAWEILDLTRALFEQKLEEIKEQGEKIIPPFLESDKEKTDNEYIILTQKLSETYDILGEVSLEAENFPQSAIDLEKCLALRLNLYNPDKSSLISESHYKLSLALEFCVEDPASRSKAVEHMHLAIESVKRRNEHETRESEIKNNEDLLQDLIVRCQEIEKDPSEEIKSEQLDIIKGILGESTSEDSNKINNLTSLVKTSSKPAVNDLTSMVKKRKPKSKSEAPSKKSKN